MTTYEHSTAVPIETLLPDIEELLGRIVKEYHADLGLVSSSDITNTNVLIGSDITPELPTRSLPHHGNMSFCMMTIHRPTPVIITSLNKNRFFFDHPLTKMYNFVTYVGLPIVYIDNVQEDHYIGSMCLFFRHEVSNDIRAYDKILREIEVLMEKKIKDKNVV